MAQISKGEDVKTPEDTEGKVEKPILGEHNRFKFIGNIPNEVKRWGTYLKSAIKDKKQFDEAIEQDNLEEAGILGNRQELERQIGITSQTIEDGMEAYNVSRSKDGGELSGYHNEIMSIVSDAQDMLRIYQEVSAVLSRKEEAKSATDDMAAYEKLQKELKDKL